MVKLTEEYGILTEPVITYPLRHFCNVITEKGYPVSTEYMCYVCKKKTPQKILFMYKLWKWHNG